MEARWVASSHCRQIDAVAQIAREVYGGSGMRTNMKEAQAPRRRLTALLLLRMLLRGLHETAWRAAPVLLYCWRTS